MDKVNKDEVSIRANISVRADENVQKFKSSQRSQGIKRTKEKTIDYMLLNFKDKK